MLTKVFCPELASLALCTQNDCVIIDKYLKVIVFNGFGGIFEAPPLLDFRRWLIEIKSQALDFSINVISKF